jgi:deaminated glutathione amidase
MKSSFRVAAVQMRSGVDKQANLAEATRLVALAAERGAELVVLPELFNLCGDLRRAAAEAEPMTGATARFLSELAATHHIWLVGGSIAEQASDGEAADKAYNSSLLFDPEGMLHDVYRKMHLFDVDLGLQLRVQESDSLLPGQKVTSLATDLAHLGLAICYDLRFPELFRELSSRGVELLCIPAAFTKKTGQDHWQLLVRARAVENQCYVIAANQAGEHAPGNTSYGHSLIVDPWGRILAEASEEQAEVITADISAERLLEVRRCLPSLQHRMLL